MYTVVKQAPAVSREASVSSFEVPGFVLVVSFGRPEESTEVLLDGSEDVVDNLVENAVGGRKEFGENGNFSFRVRDDGDNVKGLVTVDCERLTLEVADDFCDRLSSALDVLVPFLENPTKALVTNSVDTRVLEELVSSTKESTGTGIGEELLLKRIRRDDRYGGGTGKVVEKFFDLA